VQIWVAVVGLLVSLFACAWSGEATTLEERKIGDWQLVAVADDAGNAAACYVLGASFSNGQSMSFLIDDKQEWYLVFHSEKWGLGDDATRELTYAIDGGAPITATAYGLGPSMLRVPLGVNFEATETLRRGSRLEVRFRQGGQASFSLKGSSSALDALLACATRHLRYQDDPEIVRIGRWLVLRERHEDGSCRAGIDGDHETMFTFSHDKTYGYFIRISHSNHQWRLRDGEKYVLTYRIDDGPQVESLAGASANTVLFLLERDSASLNPFKNGRVLHVHAQRQDLTVDLRDAKEALEALEACATGMSKKDSALADPFSSTSPFDTPAPAPVPAPVLDPEIERSIDAVKQLLIMQVIFKHDPSAEGEFSDRVHQAAQAMPDGKKAVLAEVQAFLKERIRKAFKVAPADAFAKLAQEDRDVLQRLQDRPDACAGFFGAAARGDAGSVPLDLRKANSDRLAEIVEAASTRPALPSQHSEEELVAWIAQAYVALGYPREDLALVDNLKALDDREVCRVGTELMTAVASLSVDQAGEVYRWMKMSTIEP
jgi:hypothetical protein